MECAGIIKLASRVMGYWFVPNAKVTRYHCPTVPYSNIRVGQVPLGLVVQEVKGITQFTPDCLNLQLDLFKSNALFTGMHSGAARDLAGTECWSDCAFTYFAQLNLDAKIFKVLFYLHHYEVLRLWLIDSSRNRLNSDGTKGRRG